MLSSSSPTWTVISFCALMVRCANRKFAVRKTIALGMDPSKVSTVTPPKNKVYGATLEEALSEIGRGRYQTWVSVVGGICFLAAGIENSLNAYILPSVKCDLGIVSSQMGLLNASFLAGGVVSGLLWGSLVDIIGRWPVIFYGTLLDGTMMLVSSLSQDFYTLLAFRFLSGFIVGGPSSIVQAYIGEFHGLKWRAQAVCYSGLFWTFAWLLLPALAWIIIPMSFRWTLFGLVEFNSWRLLIVLVSLPSWTSVILLLTLPESPKFLSASNQSERALQVLKDMYSSNTQTTGGDFPVKSLEKDSGLDVKIDSSNKSTGPLLTVLRQCRMLFTGPVFYTTALSSFLGFSNMFGYYGLGLWLPELVNRFETFETLHPNMTASVCNLAIAAVNETATSAECATSSTVFQHSVIIGVAALVGNLISGVLSPLLPRKVMPVGFSLAAAVAVFSLFLVRSSLENLIVAALFTLCIAAANTLLTSLVVDLFPPEISGIAVCVFIMMGRVGAVACNLVFGHLLDISCSVPIFVCAGFILAGAFLTMFIPPPYSMRKKDREVVVVAT